MAKQHVVATVKQVLTDWEPALSSVVTSKPVIVFPNGDGTPPDAPEPYLAVQFPVANSDRTTHSRSFVEEGAARIVILDEIASGTAWELEIGEQVEALFRARKINGIDFLTPTSPLMNDDNDQGNYFRSSVVIPYLYHWSEPD